MDFTLGLTLRLLRPKRLPQEFVSPRQSTDHWRRFEGGHQALVIKSAPPTVPFDTPAIGMAATPDCQPFSHVLSRLNYYTYEKYKAQTMCKMRFGSQGMILGFKEEN